MSNIGSWRAAMALAALATLGGCSTTSPPTQWHSLVAPGAAAGSAAAGPRTLLVGLVTLPEEVDRPGLVLRAADGTPQLLDEQRWVEPLKGQLPRGLALALSARLPGWVVAASPSAALPRPGGRLVVDVQRFELQRGPRAGALLRAVWTLRPAGADDAQVSASPQLFETFVTAPDEPAALVAAMRAALDALATRIAADAAR